MRGDPRVTLAMVAMMAGMSGATQAHAQGAAHPPIPQPRVETVPPPPGRLFLWEPGHWRWDGAAYAWEPGRYVPRRARYARFVPGHWRPQGAGWIWMPAHWS